MLRSNYCGKVNIEHLGKEVELAGWVNTWRDHGGVIFIDLRDRTGVVQLVFNPAVNKEVHAVAQGVRAAPLPAFKIEVMTSRAMACERVFMDWYI